MKLEWRQWLSSLDSQELCKSCQELVKSQRPPNLDAQRDRGNTGNRPVHLEVFEILFR